jgi:hypothetical protein
MIALFWFWRERVAVVRGPRRRGTVAIEPVGRSICLSATLATPTLLPGTLSVPLTGSTHSAQPDSGGSGPCESVGEGRKG